MVNNKTQTVVFDLLCMDEIEDESKFDSMSSCQP